MQIQITQAVASIIRLQLFHRKRAKTQEAIQITAQIVNLVHNHQTLSHMEIHIISILQLFLLLVCRLCSI